VVTLEYESTAFPFLNTEEQGNVILTKTQIKMVLKSEFAFYVIQNRWQWQATLTCRSHVSCIR